MRTCFGEVLNPARGRTADCVYNKATNYEANNSDGDRGGDLTLPNSVSLFRPA
jgi:hypothetical protein